MSAPTPFTPEQEAQICEIAITAAHYALRTYIREACEEQMLRIREGAVKARDALIGGPR